MNIINTPQIFTAKVMHKRLFPKVNGFNYSVYYLSLPLNELQNISSEINYNKWGLTSFYNSDHGYKNGASIKDWVFDILQGQGLPNNNLNITLIALPRIIGYVFNPVSFYLCFTPENKLKYVIYEVNNTFNETHTYITYKPDFSEILPQDVITAEKIFHVSPFLERSGEYKFSVGYKNEKLSIFIDYYDENGNKKFVTSLIGGFKKLTKTNLLIEFLKHPLVTFKTIFLIHVQAVKILYKGIKYIPKPKQNEVRISAIKITKN